VNGSAYLGRARFLNDGGIYESGDRMTVASVGNKTLICFSALVAFAIIGWMLASQMFAGDGMQSIGVNNTSVMIPDTKVLTALGIALAATLVFGIINAVKREPSKICIVGYAVCEGLLVGAISCIYNHQYDGIVGQAVIATFCVVGVSILVFRTGVITRNRARVRTFAIIALLSYLALSIVNIVLVLTGVMSNWGIWGTPLGIVISLFAICLGALMLSIDLDRTMEGIERGVAERYSWSIAYAFLLDVVWIYLEILRFLAITRSRK
jgi:uncharacterized YccA/Bax inhibitor family protein